MLRGGEQLEVLDNMRIPLCHVADELFQQRDRAFALAVADRVGNVAPQARRRACARQLIAHQVADVGDGPFRARLDKLIVVELCQVFLQHSDLFRKHLHQRVERHLEFVDSAWAYLTEQRGVAGQLLQVADAIDGGQEIIQGIEVKAHGISSRMSKGCFGSMSSSSAGVMLPPVCGWGGAAVRDIFSSR